MKWYEIKAAVGSAEADIFIYDQIGESMFADGVGAKAFAQELAACRASQINLHINSPGGSVFEGTAIYNAIQRHPANVTAYIDGLAASIASVVALAANKVVMARNALFMIHDPRGTVRDATGKEMRQTADVMDKVHDICVDAYTAKTGAPAEVISAAMAAETWYNAQQAKDAGFADEIGAPMELAAVADVATLEALGYHNLPESIRAGACGASDLPLGDKDAAWDGSAARASIQEWAGGDDFDPAKMKQGFFWFDDAKPKNSGSYKLPFATVSGGKLTAMPAGIHACANVMSGGRGGADIPSGDVAAVKSRIAGYYSKMGEKVPWAVDSTDLNPGDLGRVLSQVNYDKLVQAREVIQEVLTSSDRQGTQPGQDDEGSDDDEDDTQNRARDASGRLPVHVLALSNVPPLEAHKEAIG